MEQAKTPKAYINIKDLGFAPIATEDGGTATYGAPIQTRGLKTVGLPAGGEITVAWADGAPIESAVGDGEPTLTLGLHQLSPEIEEMIFDKTFDASGISEENWGHQPKPVAVWFKSERKDGSYRWTGFKKVLFAPPEEERAAKEGEIEFGEYSIEGRIMKVEGSEAKKIMADTRRSGETPFNDDTFFTRLLGDSYTPNTTTTTTTAAGV
ncbi:major tail protein [Salinicoccus sp. HZC-1]|uniref:major tail protein n=1 Tax=Salinicoccus sp. HZC-1 TaxID=3385497 RepID=UPI00398A79BA